MSHRIGEPAFKITIFKDGTSNLDATMLQNIHDYMSGLFPKDATGTISGIWRNLEDERPVFMVPRLPESESASSSESRGGRSSKGAKKAEVEGEEPGVVPADVAREITIDIYKKQMVKFETETKVEAENHNIQMFSVYHSFCDSKVRGVLKDLKNEDSATVV